MKLKHFFLVLLFITMSNINAQSLDIPLVSVSETETAYAPIDEIHFSLQIKTKGAEIGDARNKNRKIAESVFSYLDKKKIPKKYIQTKRMSVSRNYIRRGERQEYDGFIANQEIYVCLTEMDAFDEILDALLQMDVESINGPNFKSTTAEEVLKEARLKALVKARESAQKMAQALGQDIGKAKLINTQVSNSFRGNNSFYSDASMERSSAGSGQTSYEAGQREIKATVNVSFELL